MASGATVHFPWEGRAVSLTYDIKVKGLDELRQRFAESPELVESETRRALRVSIDHLEEQVAGRWPVFTGQGRGSTATEVRGSKTNLRGIVGTPLIYGLPVELGREPGKMPPVAAIEYWVIRKGIASPPESRSVAFLIARAIGRRGTEGAFMFEKGWEASEGTVEKIFDEAVERVLERLAR